MIFEFGETERKLLWSLKEGFSQILIYGSCYPSAVSFVLRSNKTVTLGAKGEDVAPRFEVFPMTVTEESLKTDPVKVIECKSDDQSYKISILQKSEWSVPASQKEKSQMLGETCGATTQYEGRLSDIPDIALNQATLHAGVEIKGVDGWSFLVATAMFPFTLYVSDCDFSESMDPAVYDRIEMSQ